MKRTHKVILIISIVVLVVLIAIFGYRSGIISKAKTGYLLYAEKSIMVFDLETNVKNEYAVDGYAIESVGKYYGGDFCCEAINNETGEREILLFKNGKVEKSCLVPENNLLPAVFNDKVYYLTEDGKLNCVSDKDTELIASGVEEFSLNTRGEIAYIKEITDEEYSAERNINGELYYYVNGEEIKLGEAYSVQWLTDKELLVGAEKVEVEYDADGEIVSAAHIPEDYIVTTDNNEWTYSKEFNKIPFVVAFSSDSKKAITRTTDESFTYWLFGIYDIEKNVFSKTAIYDGINNEKVFEDMGANILWLDENPMD